MSGSRGELRAAEGGMACVSRPGVGGKAGGSAYGSPFGKGLVGGLNGGGHLLGRALLRRSAKRGSEGGGGGGQHGGREALGSEGRAEGHRGQRARGSGGGRSFRFSP